MLKYKIKKSFRKIFGRSEPEIILPPATSKEQLLIDETRETFQEIPVVSTKNLSSSALDWAKNMNRLREHILYDDPRRFLTWDVIGRTMFVAKADYLLGEYNYLKAKADYQKRWESAIQESPVGSPVPFEHLSTSSGNLIHHAYHLALFEEKTELSFSDFDFIFEFGGGYGNMCKLIHSLGFNKKYILFDLPHFSVLQKYYIKSLGLKLLDTSNFSKEDTGILCLSEIDELKTILNVSKKSQENSLFIAAWSLSETPEAVRESIIPLVKDYSAFFIGYQNDWGEVSNVSYFDGFKKDHNEIAWHEWEIPHIVGCHYLVGRKQ